MAGPLLRLKQQFFTVEGNRKVCSQVTVKPLHNSHLWDIGKWLLLRVGHYGEVGL